MSVVKLLVGAISACVKISGVSSLAMVFLMIVMLTGCDSLGFILKPMSLDMTPPPGPPEYQQGFTDGCESGISGYANAFYKSFHHVHQDPELAQNKVYYQIWKDAYAYCSVYIMAQKTHGYGNRDFNY